MKNAWRRLVLVCLGVVVTAVVAAGGLAGNRTDTVKGTFAALPGPGKVTYGENLAYRATLENKSGTTLTHVRFRQVYPEVKRPGETAAPLGDPVDSNCALLGGTTSKDTVTIDGKVKSEWVCDFGTRAADAPKIVLTVVWNVPVPSDDAQAKTNCDDCLSSFARWTVKEGANDVTDPNDTFGASTVYATLLGNVSGADEKLRAGGYETTSASCADTEGAGSLRTTPNVTGADPLNTTVCIPDFALTDQERMLGLGFAVTINEPANSARSAQVCIASLGQSCDDPNVVDATFGAPYVTHIFHVAVAGLPKNYNITQVFHNKTTNPTALPTCASSPDNANGCVESITPPKGNYKIWIVVARAPTNGQWDW